MLIPHKHYKKKQHHSELLDPKLSHCAIVLLTFSTSKWVYAVI